MTFSLTGLNGREYKMLLKRRRFSGLPEQAARRLWKKLAPFVGDYMDGAGGPGTFDAVFMKQPEDRPVRFRDTAGHFLDSRGYSLRVRKNSPDREITLKLRTPDIFISGLAQVSGGGGAQTKFEEDIAPLEVQRKRRVTSASEPSIRSRFSRSTTQPFPPGTALDTLDDAFALFHDLEKSLAGFSGETPKRTSALLEGPDIREYVFKSEDVRLLKGVKVEFALTLWYFNRKREPDIRSVPNVAEVSFKWEIEKRDKDKDKGGLAASGKKAVNGALATALDEETIRRGAARALDMFIAMQGDLTDWINIHEASKTKLALPGRRRGGATAPQDRQGRSRLRPIPAPP